MSEIAETTPGLAPALDPPDSFWRSLHYFNVYRLGVATVFVCAILIYGGSLSFGSQNPGMFAWVSVAYLFLSLLFYGALQRLKRGFSFHLTLQVATDILALTLLMYASGGAKSGMAFMLLVVWRARDWLGRDA